MWYQISKEKFSSLSKNIASFANYAQKSFLDLFPTTVTENTLYFQFTGTQKLHEATEQLQFMIFNALTQVIHSKKRKLQMPKPQ